MIRSNPCIEEFHSLIVFFVQILHSLIFSFGICFAAGEDFGLLALTWPVMMFLWTCNCILLGYVQGYQRSCIPFCEMCCKKKNIDIIKQTASYAGNVMSIMLCNTCDLWFSHVSYFLLKGLFSDALTFRHRASSILGQAFRYSPEKALYIFNQQIYFIIWYLLDHASLI